ncbi:MAG: hypothetical protein K0R50_1296 [Eubacterium sp.]|jgi:VanZ family protein|nr:hypothetical protein [Eubacterium sp.]
MNRKLNAKLINIVFFILQISLILAFIPQKKYMNSGFSAAVLLLYLLFLLYEHKKGITITNFIRISVIVSLLANGFLGDYLQLYNTSVYFDKLLHVFGTFSFSLFIFSIAEKEGHFERIPRHMVFIFILLLGSFLGTVFEIGEYLLDVIFKTENQSSIADNNIDMICDILGATFAGIFTIYSKKGIK